MQYNTCILVITEPTSHIPDRRVANSPCPNHKLPHVIVLEYGSVVCETLSWIVWPREREMEDDGKFKFFALLALLWDVTGPSIHMNR